MDPIKQFQKEVSENVKALGKDTDIQGMSRIWIRETARHRYTYNFSWLGRPIIQFPQDIMALQEIIWQVKPDVILETGVAHGGSLVFYASMLELLGGDGFAVGIDIDIREHNRHEIEQHPFSKRIKLIEGSSISDVVAKEVENLVAARESVMVVLDSNHTHSHVLRELELYSQFVTKDSYLIVLDTIIADMPDSLFLDRPWSSTDNPKTAVKEFLHKCDRFSIDEDIQNKLLITVAPDGYLKCIKDN